MVASPEPKRIVEAPAIKALIQQGFVVIGAGGGGIPVVRTEAGDYQSVDAVIDKDLSTALLAREIHADILVITTGVRNSVSTLVNRSSRRWIGCNCHHDSLYAGRAFSARQHVAKNHRQPDVPGAGRRKEVIITTPECLPAALRGETGTRIIKTSEDVG